LYARFLCAEVEYHIVVTISVNILDVTEIVYFCRTIWPKLNAQRINGGRVKGVSG
jgi:hypothetical protein